MIEALFGANLVAHYLLLAGIVLSIARPEYKIWPPATQQSWQFYATWILFYMGAVLTTLTAVFTWDSWLIPDEIRLFIGVPLVLLGGACVLWGIHSLGMRNTHGLAHEFIELGAYQFTRNPQYVGDICLFVGLSLVVNSLYVAIPLLLQSITFTLAPLAEERWLQAQYGNAYSEYKQRISRFL